MRVEVNQDIFWNYGSPPISLRSSKMLLLTHGKIAILGTWQNTEGMVGWYPLPNRNKPEEQKRGV